MGLYVPVATACNPSVVVRILMAAVGKLKSWMSSSWSSECCVLTRFLCPWASRFGRDLTVTQDGRDAALVDDGPLTV